MRTILLKVGKTAGSSADENALITLIPARYDMGGPETKLERKRRADIQ